MGIVSRTSGRLGEGKARTVLRHPSPHSAGGVLGALFVLGKPRVSLLLFITAFTVFVYASLTRGRGLSTGDLLVFVIAGMLAPMGANSVNNYLDRDIDPLMERTKRRPLASGLLKPWVALVFGFSLLAFSGLLYAAWFGPLPAVLAIAGGLYYIFVYTVLLKRRTPWSTVVGGIAGSFPPLVGWAAATNSIGVTGLLLALVIFFWNPPHFWALAMHLRRDYERAGLPMMPIVAGARVSFAYMVLFTALTIATMVAVALVEGSVIVAGGALAAAILMSRAMYVIWKRVEEGALGAFKLSNPALGLFFLSLVTEALV